MADKSAFVPVDALQNHKAGGEDVDMDAELFGSSAKPKPVEAPPPPPPKPVEAPKPAAAAPKFQYKKATTFTKTYAGQKK